MTGFLVHVHGCAVCCTVVDSKPGVRLNIAMLDCNDALRNASSATLRCACELALPFALDLWTCPPQQWLVLSRVHLRNAATYFTI
jgi:hypothetical protein